MDELTRDEWISKDAEEALILMNKTRKINMYTILVLTTPSGTTICQN